MQKLRRKQSLGWTMLAVGFILDIVDGIFYTGVVRLFACIIRLVGLAMVLQTSAAINKIEPKASATRIKLILICISVAAGILLDVVYYITDARIIERIASAFWRVGLYTVIFSPFQKRQSNGSTQQTVEESVNSKTDNTSSS